MTVPLALDVAVPPPRERDQSRRGLLFPLDQLCRRRGLAAPIGRPIVDAMLPQPYRRLLAHDASMTVTLERHFGCVSQLRPLAALSRHAWYIRHIVLADGVSGRPLEIGVLRVRLDAFGPTVRRAILEEALPFGRVLADHGIACRSVPRSFFVVTPNSEMLALLWMTAPIDLYGRRAQLLADEQPVGEVVEILPPLPAK
jgi:hypothetical protein